MRKMYPTVGAVGAGLLASAASANAALPTEVSDLLALADTSAITAFFVGVGTVAVTAVLIQNGARWIKAALGMMPGR